MNTPKRHLEILTEEPSAEAALRKLMPRLVGPGVSVKIISHQGKGDLMKSLLGKIKVYSKVFGNGEKLVILLDRDKDDCLELKRKMESLAQQAGATTKSKALKNSPFLVVNRIAIEELEAWFLGDEKAVCAAYPKLQSFPADLQRKNPDSIKDPFEALQRTLKKAGYRNPGGKIEISRKIAAQMEKERNRSASFRVFHEGITACLK